MEKILSVKHLASLYRNPQGISVYMRYSPERAILGKAYGPWSFEITHSDRSKKDPRFNKVKSIFVCPDGYVTREEAARCVEEFFRRVNDNLLRPKVRKSAGKGTLPTLFNCTESHGLFELCSEKDLIQFKHESSAFITTSVPVTNPLYHPGHMHAKNMRRGARSPRSIPKKTVATRKKVAKRVAKRVARK